MINVKLNNVFIADVGFLNILDEWYDNGTKEPHNTDGIDPGQNSKHIHIHNCNISNGDDSVAVKPGDSSSGCTSDIFVENCNFYNGHGCSIGSVPSGCVQNVVFRHIYMYNQLGGCNIKSYNSGPGFIQNISFENIQMTNMDNCITINTNYQPSSQSAQIKITDVRYSTVSGMNCKNPAEFSCQSAETCTGISMIGVNLSGGKSATTMTCENAFGQAVSVSPPSCLSPGAVVAEVTDVSTAQQTSSSVMPPIFIAIICLVVFVVIMIIVVVVWKRNMSQKTEVV
jgi:polygalacturonase